MKVLELAWQIAEAHATHARTYAYRYDYAPRTLQWTGLGATHAALGAGRPSVVVHRCFDQPYNADRVRALHAGVAVPWTRLSPTRLADAIRDAVEDPRHTAGAQAVRSLIEAAPKPAIAAAEAVEKVLAG